MSAEEFDTSRGGQVQPEEQPFSGLKNPQAAVRGVGMATLIIESVVLLLAVVPIAKFGAAPGLGVGVILALVVACFVGCGLLRTPMGWWFGFGLQLAVTASGFLHPAMFALGGVFLLIWIYILRVRKTVSQPAVFDH